MTTLRIDIYGYSVVLRSASEPALDGLAEDFAFFRRPESPGPCELTIELLEEDPAYNELPQDLVASVYTPRNVSYTNQGLTILDYSGRALAIHDPAAKTFRVFSRSVDLLYEAAYLFLLSQAGEFLDSRRLHRVHALGVSVAGRAALVLLPMGGGKSTLGYELLRYPEVEILSDDSPLIDARGHVRAFPLRIGVLPGFEGEIPESQLRFIRRMEFGPKLALNYSYFARRVVPHAQPGCVFLGHRSLGTACVLRRATRTQALRAMFVNCVVGLGLFQGMEFVFHRGAREVVAKAAIARSRLKAARALLRRSSPYHLVLGRDPRENGRVLVEFLKKSPSKTKRTDFSLAR
ncbi:MAG: hypothetical protein KIT09_01805 [Bryobacteraceae bacterium]|nr:hypothetical protein [Bryobacteraceae bacterium]